ncbi:polyamine ABC transporter substrate-binding protein [Marivibrio halodurans]|uniref:Putrescine-binding periplasmic protein n=1 Tax=Marivibrio halodurans TaxID=2039722 RepID=A0A8J7S3C6_9PROT|nr:polyamine ABC transporter substrate-binding protein [Marivibrio halodurans]MBP5857818.1 polyamine ABC transporter substrate-binding protein [Marivibrio halodurans]
MSVGATFSPKTALKAGVAALAAVVGLSGAASAQDEVVNVYNWSDYIAEDTIANFEAETGIKVRYDVFDSNEVLEAKLLAGNSGYDIVVPTSTFLARQIQAGVFMELDKSKLPNWENLDETLLKRVDPMDPGNAHGMPYMWGTTGFAYNKKMIAERMPDAPVNSWDMMMDPEVVSKFADCGVSFLDAPTEVIPAALNYVGADPAGQDVDKMEEAMAHMDKVRPSIKYFHSSQNINDLANGDICLAMGWSGDMFIARDRAAEADQGVEIEYVIPKEGALLWTDMMAIPKDAPNADNAHAFLNYIMKPEVAAGISNYVWYANANSAATEFVDEEVKGDPAIYPDQETMQNLYTVLPWNPRYQREATRAWTKLKTGQ